MKALKIIWNVIYRLVFLILGIIVLVILLLQLNSVQNFIVSKVTKKISTELKTDVKIDRVSIGFFDRLNLDGVLIKDLNKDTLLSAGSLKLRITDWFFLKEKVELKYIGLENAVVKMDRSDSVWNYQFLVDYFTPATPRQKRKKKIQLDLKKLDLKNVLFQRYDFWIGKKIFSKVGLLYLDAENMDFVNNKFSVNSINLLKPVVVMEDIVALKESADTIYAKKDSLYFNKNDIWVQVKNLKISDGLFTYRKFDAYKTSQAGVFDSRNLVFRNLDLSATDYLFSKDTMTAAINMKAKERSGFDLQRLSAKFKLTPQKMEFNNLDLRAAESYIGDYLSLNFKDLSEDFKNIESDVQLNIKFTGSRVATNDLGYFVPDFKNWKKVYALSGKLSGPFNDFGIQDFYLKSDDDMYAQGQLHMTGLPDINNTLIDFTNMQLSTSAARLSVFAPKITSIKSPDFGALGRLNYRGSFKGTIHNFATKGSVSTALGNISADIKMQLPRSGEPVYSGTISTTQFHLGRFLLADDIGNISFSGNIDGHSYDINEARANLKGHFDVFEYKDYAYKMIDVNGLIQNRFFTGELSIADSNAQLISNAIIDFNGEKPKFNIVGDLAILDLQKTNLNKKANLNTKDFTISALFDLDFEGKNIDDFTGSAKMLNAIITLDTVSVQFDSLIVNAHIDDQNHKMLNILSNEFEAEILGNYSILELPSTVQVFLNRYYPAIIKKPVVIPKDQQISFKVNTYNFTKYASLINKHIGGFDNATITGEINTYSNGKFYLNTSIPNFRYKNYRFANTEFKGEGDYNKLDLLGKVSKIYVSDSSSFPNTEITISSEKDHSHVKIATGNTTSSINEINLDADIYTQTDGVKINFRPSYFVLNNKKWDLQERGEIFTGKRIATARNVKFSQGEQQLTVETEGANSNNLLIRLQKIDVGDVMPLILPAPKLEGVANGEVRLKNFYGAFSSEAQVTVDEFKLDNDSVGTIVLNNRYDGATQTILFDGKSDNENYRFTLDGRYRLLDSTDMPLAVNFDFKGTRGYILNQFLGTILSDINADVYGKLAIYGNFKNPYLIGDVSLRDVTMKVNFTQVQYHADTINLSLTSDYIDLGKITLKDRYANSGHLQGRIYHNRLNDMRYNITAAAEKLLVLNTEAKDNSNFYGKAIGKIDFAITGPQELLQMNITGSIADSSDLYIPTGDNKKIASADFMDFKQYGKQIEDDDKRPSSLSVNMDFMINTLANMYLILDPLTGDVINAKGNGRLQIAIPSVGPITMRGRYNIASGRYNFNFQSFVPKPFEFTKDADNYIEWNGDISKAILHIDAQYTAQNVNVNDLLANNSAAQIFSNSNIRTYRGDVYVIVEIRGDMMQPDIGFKLDFPAGSVLKSDPDFSAFLSRLSTDKNEMVKQATYLIVFNSFAPYGQTSNVNLASAGVNTLSQMITSELNRSLSDALFKITGDRSLQVDISGSTYSSASLYGNAGATNAALDRQIINARISKSIMNGRVIVTFGNNFDFNINSASALRSNNFQWLPDISVQIVLSRDGRLRMLIFNRSSLGMAGLAGDIGRQSRQGVSLSYSKDFNKFLKSNKKLYRDSATTDSIMQFK